MANTDIVQVIAEARADARSLSEFVFKPADFMVTRRLAPPINTLQFYIDIIDNTVGSIDQVLTDISASATTKVTDIVSGVEANAQGSIAGAVNRADDKISTAILNAVLSSGFVTVDSFELGATITQRNQALRHAVDGKLYRWAGDLPKSVPAESTPESSGGFGDNAWLEVSDVTLRQGLANPDMGANLIAYSDSAVYDENSIGWAVRTAGGSAFAPSRNVRYTPVTDGIQLIASRLRDGVLYGAATGRIHRSFDKGATWTPVGGGVAGNPNLLVKAGDGEVVVSCASGGLYRSQGWVTNPETCTWVSVLHAPDSDFLSWGLDSTGDGKLVCSHYRATDYTKSRYVWLSNDSGVSWQPILDLGENTYYHLHCVAFDPWANNRIWVSYHAEIAQVGRMKYLGYTDDNGATWVRVSDKWQPTTAVATPNGMTFGTDDGGGGILHIPRTENPADMQVVVAAPFPVEQTDFAWVFAIYGEYDETTGVAYHSFISQVTSVEPYGAIGTPAGIFATDGINASQLLQVDGQANTNGFREFALLDKDVVFKTRLNSPDDVTGATTNYYTFIEKAVRGESAPLQFDTGRMFGGKLIGDNPYRSLAVGTRSVAGPGDDATAIGNLAKAESPFPGATAIGSRAQALGTGTVAIGFSSLGAVSSAAIGGHAQAGNFGVSVGRESVSLTSGAAVGYRASARSGSVAIGREAGPRVADVSSSYAAIGAYAKADSSGVALGGNAVAYPRSVALGYGASASTDAVALGYQAKANHPYSIAFPGTSTSQTYEVAFGPRVLTLNEKASPETPAADAAGLFLRRTGGVQELCIRFANGTTKVVVTDTVDTGVLE